MTCNSILRISNYTLQDNKHVITFMEQHKDFNKVLSATVPMSIDEGTLEDVARAAWGMVKDEFAAWRTSVDTGTDIRRFFELDDQGNLQFLS